MKTAEYCTYHAPRFHHRSALQLTINNGMRQEWCAENPVARVEKPTL
ncbi:MAG: hypothetical protein IJ498_08605 [Akkermansia sp.]|nr:hypothetical protein [Akkermansia sp.]